MKGGDNQTWGSRDGEWVCAWNAQATEALRRRAVRFACRRAQLVARRGGRSDPGWAEELAQDVLADTWLGRLRWDPGRVSLLRHVHDAIWSRSGMVVRRLTKKPHYSIDASGDDDSDDDDGLLLEVEERLFERSPTSSTDERMLGYELVAKLRELASGDRDVLRLIEAYCAGASERGDAIAIALLSPSAYEAARNRLDRLVQELPNGAVPRTWRLNTSAA